MKTYGLATVLGMILSLSSFAREPIPAPPSFDQVYYQPTPAAEYSPEVEQELQPAPIVTQAPPVFYEEPGVIFEPAVTLPMFQNVRVRQTRNIHPCAARKIVAVPDPCNKCGCVYIEICVPPCDVAQIKCNRRGDKLRYDFGKYAVDITSRRGLVLVDYDD